MVRLLLILPLLMACASNTSSDTSWTKKCFYDDRYGTVRCWDWPERDPKK